MKCPRCDSLVSFDSQFCNKCGCTLKGLIKTIQEQSVWLGRVSAKALVSWYALWIVWAALLTWLLLKLFEAPGGFVQALYWVLLLGPLVYFAFLVLKAKATTRYRVTTHRVTVETGLFSRTSKEALFDRVDDVLVQQKFLERIVDVGTVTVFSSIDGRLELRGVSAPVALKDRLSSLVAAHKGAGPGSRGSTPA